MFLIVDAAPVGHLGVEALAGLGIAAAVLQTARVAGGGPSRGMLRTVVDSPGSRPLASERDLRERRYHRGASRSA